MNDNSPLEDFKSWYFSKPVVTRTYITGSFIIAVLVSLGIVSPYSMYYTFSQTFFQFEIWRPITTLFFQGKFSFNFLFSVYFCYFAISRLQTQIFSKQTFADLLFLIMYLYGTFILIASFIDLYFIGDGFIFAMIYIWCKRRPFETLRLMFGFQVKSGYFPFVYMGFQVLMGGSFLGYVIGFLLGHIYVYCKDIYLPKYHKDYLRTPNFLKNLVNKQYTRVQRNQRAGGNVFGGRGVRLD